jgi:hypothetical protein
LWEKFKLRYEAELAAKKPIPIKVTLPDGKVIDGQSWRTTPYEVAKGIRYAKHLEFLIFSCLWALTYRIQVLFVLTLPVARFYPLHIIQQV